MENFTVKELMEMAEKAQTKTEGLPYVIVRTYSAGVYAGYLANREGRDITLHNARNLRFWKGALDCNEMAMLGVSKPDECQFSAPVDKIILTEGIAVIYATDAAQKSIKGVRIWSKR